MDSLARHTGTPDGVDRQLVLRELRSLVRAHCGISFRSDEAQLFTHRVEALCTTLGLPPEALLTRVNAGDVRLTRSLIEAASTNYTYFFREPEIFDFVADLLLANWRPRELTRVWSAAASSGEEAYSLAMALHERMGDVARTDVRILGTDISERQLRVAESATFSAEQTFGLSQPRRERWTTTLASGAVQLHPALREMCTFRRMNLTRRPWPFELRFNVVFLRNVLYYFDADMRRELLDACYQITQPGGYLITSLTEPMVGVDTRWVQVRPAVFRR